MQLMNTFAMLSLHRWLRITSVVSGGLSRECVLDIVWTVNTVTCSTVKSRRMRGNSNWYAVSARRKAEEGEGNDVVSACTCTVLRWCDAVNCTCEWTVAGKTRCAA